MQRQTSDLHCHPSRRDCTRTSLAQTLFAPTLHWPTLQCRQTKEKRSKPVPLRDSSFRATPLQSETRGRSAARYSSGASAISALVSVAQAPAGGPTLPLGGSDLLLLFESQCQFARDRSTPLQPSTVAHLPPRLTPSRQPPKKSPSPIWLTYSLASVRMPPYYPVRTNKPGVKIYHTPGGKAPFNPQISI